jgi:hypothetical protein
MNENEFITKQETDLPIGSTGFFINSDLYDGNYSVINVIHLEASLYNLKLVGMKFLGSDETGTTHGTCYDAIILDMDDQSIIDGYAVKISAKLWAIFNIESDEVGWPAEDIVCIKNIQTGERSIIECQAPLKEEVERVGNFFLFQGSLGQVVNGFKFIETRRWASFINEEGKKIYSGFCWDYELKPDSLIIKRGKRSTSYKIIYF